MHGGTGVFHQRNPLPQGRDLGLDQTKFNPEEDRVMLCGSMAMIKETASILEGLGFTEGAMSGPGTFVLERAFVG